MSWSTLPSSILFTNRNENENNSHQADYRHCPSVSESETRKLAEQWIDENFIPDGHFETLSTDHTLVDIRLDYSEEDQDGVVLVSWPESQELCMYEGFYENCDFVSGDTIEPCSYLVNKNWYGKLINGELQKDAEYQAA